MLINLSELVSREVEMVECCNVLLQLVDAARTDEHRRHACVAQRPGERHLREALPAPFGNDVQRPNMGEVCVGEQVLSEGAVLASARVFGNAVEVTVGEQPLSER